MPKTGVQGECPDELHQGVGPWTDFTQPSVTEQRTHFGLWCTLSSPLTLSLDFTNTTAVDSVWGIITNTHALGVNQAWGGSQGTIFATAGEVINLGPVRMFCLGFSDLLFLWGFQNNGYASNQPTKSRKTETGRVPVGDDH